MSPSDDTNAGETDEAVDDGSVRVDRLEDTVRSLAATVRRLATGQTLDASAIEILDEVAPTDGEQLVTWVRWLTERYQLGATLPPCWPLHGQLVEELDALRVGWRDTVAAGQGGLAAMQWHDYFGRTLERIDHRWRVCPDGTHRDTEPADWLADGPQGADNIGLERDRLESGY